MLNAKSFHLHKVTCTVCKRSVYQNYLDIRGFKIVKCLNCGMVYTNPCPTEDELRELYESASYQPVERRLRQLKYILLVKFIERFAKIHGKFLDIGCSQGDFGRAVMKNKRWGILNDR